jgi:hypothetical protein
MPPELLRATAGVRRPTRCACLPLRPQPLLDAATPPYNTSMLVPRSGDREFLGSWINSSAVHEAKKRRGKQVITCSFPCGKWLHMIGARASPKCELCKRESVIGAQNRCLKHLIGAISTHGEATRDLEFIGGDKDRHGPMLILCTKIGCAG